MSNILITGAHGFIGKYLARWMKSQGHQVHGIGHGHWSSEEAGFWGLMNWMNGDINLSNLRLLSTSIGTPDVIFHLAGGSSVRMAFDNPREDFYRTVATTVDLLEWVRSEVPSMRIVLISSAAIYGSGNLGKISENVTAAPCSTYGNDKAITEQLCRSFCEVYGLDIVVARLFSVYGCGLKKQLLWDICSRMETGSNPLKLSGSGSELRDWMDVRDVVRALELLGTCNYGDKRTFNVGSGVGTSVREVAELLLQSWKETRSPPPSLAFSGRCPVGDPFSLVAEQSRISSLGFEPEIGLSQGIHDYVKWYLAGKREA